MKRLQNLTLFGALALLFIHLAGCGGSSAQSGKGPTAGEPVTEITVTGDDRMRFSPRQFTVRAGSGITLKLVNTGSMPKETMGHNWVLLETGVPPRTFSATALAHPKEEYIPPRYADKVIASSKVLGPGESEIIVFTAPSQAGEYPFVCSFPGHTEAGMTGVMIVVE